MRNSVNTPQVSASFAFEDPQRFSSSSSDSSSSIYDQYRLPTPTNILPKYFAVYPPFLLMWASDVAPRCTPFAVLGFLLSRPLLPLLHCSHPSFCTHSQALIRSSLTKRSLHVLICPIVQYTAIPLCLWKPLCRRLILCNDISLHYYELHGNQSS